MTQNSETKTLELTAQEHEVCEQRFQHPAPDSLSEDFAEAYESIRGKLGLHDGDTLAKQEFERAIRLFHHTVMDGLHSMLGMMESAETEEWYTELMNVQACPYLPSFDEFVDNFSLLFDSSVNVAFCCKDLEWATMQPCQPITSLQRDNSGTWISDLHGKALQYCPFCGVEQQHFRESLEVPESLGVKGNVGPG